MDVGLQDSSSAASLTRTNGAVLVLVGGLLPLVNLPLWGAEGGLASLAVLGVSVTLLGAGFLLLLQGSEGTSKADVALGSEPPRVHAHDRSAAAPTRRRVRQQPRPRLYRPA